MSRRGLPAAVTLLGLGLSLLTPLTSVARALEPPADPVVPRIDYPGHGIEVRRTSGDQRMLAGTPRSFKRFVRARLDVLFEDAGSRPRCATSPTVVVSRYHGGGWARAGEGWYSPCPAGGYAVIYEKASSGWRQVLGTQELRFCQDLAWYRVPRFIAGRTCMNERVKEVRYRRGRSATDSATASARRVASVAHGNPIVPVKEVLTPASEEQLVVVIARKGYVTIEECVRAGDADPAAAHLGGAPHGCRVTVTYRKGRTESVMLRMDENFVVTELYPVP